MNAGKYKSEYWEIFVIRNTDSIIQVWELAKENGAEDEICFS